MNALHAYQIVDAGARTAPGFEPLVRKGDAASGWSDYLTLRAALTGEPLDEHAFYGAIGPGSRAQSPLTAQALHDTVAALAPSVDVLLLAGASSDMAYVWNVFEQDQARHPALLEVAQRFFVRVGRPQSLKERVSHSRTIAPAGHFVARPRFWRAWLELTEPLYAIAQSPDDELGRALRAPAGSGSGARMPMMLCLLERVASYLLMSDARFEVELCADPATRAPAPMALLCDALKIAYAQTGRGQYRVVFDGLRALRRAWRQRAS